MKKIIIFLFLLVLIGANVAAAVTKYSFPFLQVSSEADYNLGYFIGKFYQWSLGLASLAALISIIVAGIRITASAGNVSTVDDARNQITQAILGLALLFGAYLILHIIDPGLTSLKDPHFEKITLKSGERYYKILSEKIIKGTPEKARELGRQEGEKKYKNTSLKELLKAKQEAARDVSKINKITEQYREKFEAYRKHPIRSYFKRDQVYLTLNKYKKYRNMAQKKQGELEAINDRIKQYKENTGSDLETKPE